MRVTNWVKNPAKAKVQGGEVFISAIRLDKSTKPKHNANGDFSFLQLAKSNGRPGEGYKHMRLWVNYSELVTLRDQLTAAIERVEELQNSWPTHDYWADTTHF